MKLTESKPTEFDLSYLQNGEVGIIIKNDTNITSNDYLVGAIVFCSVIGTHRTMISHCGRKWDSDITMNASGFLVKKINILEIIYSFF